MNRSPMIFGVSIAAGAMNRRGGRIGGICPQTSNGQAMPMLHRQPPRGFCADVPPAASSASGKPFRIMTPRRLGRRAQARALSEDPSAAWSSDAADIARSVIHFWCRDNMMIDGIVNTVAFQFEIKSACFNRDGVLALIVFSGAGPVDHHPASYGALVWHIRQIADPSFDNRDTAVTQVCENRSAPVSARRRGTRPQPR